MEVRFNLLNMPYSFHLYFSNSAGCFIIAVTSVRMIVKGNSRSSLFQLIVARSGEALFVNLRRSEEFHKIAITASDVQFAYALRKDV